MSKILPIHLAIIGATSMLGNTVLDVISERNIPLARLSLLDTEDEGEMISVGGEDYPVTSVEEFDFSGCDAVVFCGNQEQTERFVEDARDVGCTVIDLTGYSRSQDRIQKVQAEFGLEGIEAGGVYGVPSCMASILALVLHPLQQAYGIEAANITTLQSVSGSGREGVETLASQTRNLFSQQDIEPGCYEKRIAFNVLPAIGSVDDAGNSQEEEQVSSELKALLNPDLRLQLTTTRVPLFYGHSAVVSLSLGQGASVADIRSKLEKAPGVYLPSADQVLASPQDAVGGSAVWVSRIREDRSRERGITLWVTADNLRRGYALNAAQILEYLLPQFAA